MTDLSSGAASAPTTPRVFTLSDFDFSLPPELIAQHPAPERSASRLLDGRAATPVDRVFRELPGLLRAGDLVVFNNTQVIKARLFGEKATGGKLELLVERVLTDHEVVAHMKVSKKPAVGGVIHLAGGCTATLTGRWPDDNGALFRLCFSQEPHAVMQAHGHVPLPPYITHEDTAEDERRYQTVFARNPGAVAAPTASLHFDAAVLDALRERGVHTAEVTLHVGAGTFQPVKTENIADHQMHFGLHALARREFGCERGHLVAHLVEQFLLQVHRTGVDQMAQRIQGADIDDMLQRQPRAEFGGDERGAHHSVTGKR